MGIVPRTDTRDAANVRGHRRVSRALGPALLVTPSALSFVIAIVLLGDRPLHLGIAIALLTACAVSFVLIGAAAERRRSARRTTAAATAPEGPRAGSVAILDVIRDGLVHCNASGRIVAVNEAMCAMTGFSEDELVGAEPPLPYCPEEDLVNMRAFIDEVIDAGHGERELILCRENGERFPANITVGVEPTDNSRVGLVKDVSDRAAMLQQITDATTAAETAGAAFARSAEVIGEYLYSAEVLPTEELAPDAGYPILGVLDARGPGLGALLGTDEQTARPTDYDDRVHHDDVPAYYEAWRYQRLLECDGDIVQHEYRLVGFDGCFRWVRDRARVTVRDGRVFLTGAVCDMSAQRHAEAQRAAMVGQLEHLSTVDPLTELFNRRHFSAVLRERLSRPGARIAVAMGDVDHFKAINDQHGHAVGDHVLKTIARRLRQATRPDDVVARWGGEEFCILLHDVDDDNQLLALAERLRLSIQTDPISVGRSTHLAVSMSVGAARVLHSRERPEELLATADVALYRAKDAGRNRTIIAQRDEHSALRDAAQTR
jgi:diguanylate cyclase (GGDEF)-like protein/PAS domain S-box-containing protein